MRRFHVELSLTEIGDVVEASMQSMLGKVTVEEGAPIWPLSSMMGSASARTALHWSAN
jgi:hypothetical protein